VFNIESLIIC